MINGKLLLRSLWAAYWRYWICSWIGIVFVLFVIKIGMARGSLEEFFQGFLLMLFSPLLIVICSSPVFLIVGTLFSFFKFNCSLIGIIIGGGAGQFALFFPVLYYNPTEFIEIVHRFVIGMTFSAYLGMAVIFFPGLFLGSLAGYIFYKYCYKVVWDDVAKSLNLKEGDSQNA